LKEISYKFFYIYIGFINTDKISNVIFFYSFPGEYSPKLMEVSYLSSAASGIYNGKAICIIEP